MPNDTNSGAAPAVDFSAGLVPKESTQPPSATGAIDFSAGLVPKDSTQSAQPEGMAGRFGAYNELGQGVIKGAKETARTVVGAVDSAANWINQKLGTSEL